MTNDVDVLTYESTTTNCRSTLLESKPCFSEPEHKRRLFTRLRIYINHTPVQTHDLPGKAQTDAGTPGLRGEEGDEYLVLNLLRDPGSIVGHFEDYASMISHPAGEFDCCVAPVLRGLHRVEK